MCNLESLNSTFTFQNYSSRLCKPKNTVVFVIHYICNSLASRVSNCNIYEKKSTLLWNFGLHNIVEETVTCKQLYIISTWKCFIFTIEFNINKNELGF